MLSRLHQSTSQRPVICPRTLSSTKPSHAGEKRKRRTQAGARYTRCRVAKEVKSRGGCIALRMARQRRGVHRPSSSTLSLSLPAKNTALCCCNPPPSWCIYTRTTSLSSSAGASARTRGRLWPLHSAASARYKERARQASELAPERRTWRATRPRRRPAFLSINRCTAAPTCCSINGSSALLAQSTVSATTRSPLSAPTCRSTAALNKCHLMKITLFVQIAKLESSIKLSSDEKVNNTICEIAMR